MFVNKFFTYLKLISCAHISKSKRCFNVKSSTYKDEDIGRFSNVHQCTFNINLSGIYNTKTKSNYIKLKLYKI